MIISDIYVIYSIIVFIRLLIHRNCSLAILYTIFVYHIVYENYIQAKLKKKNNKMTISENKKKLSLFRVLFYVERANDFRKKGTRHDYLIN